MLCLSVCFNENISEMVGARRTKFDIWPPHNFNYIEFTFNCLQIIFKVLKSYT